MSDRRDRERERRGQAPSARTNEYFVPKDGIDREVITADICRYLGNDALVRPGNYENPQTRQISQGYFITAYRNLTTAMIADLKADSARWEDERRATASRGGQPSNVEYRASTTHQSRQYYGPTSEAAQTISSTGYQQPTSTPSGPVYDSSASGSYQQSGYAPPATAYQQTPYVDSGANYYVSGGNMGVAVDSSARAPVTTQSPIPRSNVQYASATSSYPQQQDRGAMYYSSSTQQPTVSSAQYATQPTDPYYGRGQYDSADPYDGRVYQDSSTYGQSAVTAAPVVAPTSSSSSSRRDRDTDRHGRNRDSHDRHRRN